MKISTKGIYAVSTMVRMASDDMGKIWSISALAKANNVSTKYLEQIVSKLTKNGLLVSFRGAKGGYKLAKSANCISLASILNSTEGKLQTVHCINTNTKCDMSAKCLTVGVWTKLDEVVNNFLSSITLEDIVQKKL